jgi:hypothetical protein
MPDLRLTDLKENAHELTPVFGEALAQAAAVCLDDQGHTSGRSLALKGDFSGSCALRWRRSSKKARRTWNDLEVATEYGAYGVATLLVWRYAHLKVVERSRKGTGFDFWLGDGSGTGTLFQNKARMEVSGIRKGDEDAIRRRTAAKITQTKRTSSSLPTFVVVVEFSSPQSRVVRR